MRMRARLAGEISIHAPREGSDLHHVPAVRTIDISIHAPREGSDDELTQPGCHGGWISIHAPREGSDLAVSCSALWGA